MYKLAFKGGEKIRKKKFPANNTIGLEEINAVNRVLKSGILSRYLGAWHEDFYGGPEVCAFESEWADYFGVKNAIAVNSATSGLYCAVGALEIGPGDEVIVSPYTMSASAIAPLIYNAIPVFADIENDYFCLSPISVKKLINKRTKAIIIVDIFGLPYDVNEIQKIAKDYNIPVIEDCAQAIGAKFHDKFAGTLGDIGIFSLNYHKHIHCGEGGVVVTDDDAIAERVRLIRNHAEAVIGSKGYDNLINMLGFNYRMTEISAAIGREQLKKLSNFIEIRNKNVEYINNGIKNIECLEPAKLRPGCTHSYYFQPIKFDSKIAGISRNLFIDALKAELALTELRETEGIMIGSGYVKPLYLEPLYQNKIAYGSAGCPWKCDKYNGRVSYNKGICPNAEDMHYNVLLTNALIGSGMLKEDLDDLIEAFNKVWQYREELL